MPRYMLDTDTCSSIMKRSHPMVLDVRLVTNNTAEFGRVHGLGIENWATSPRRKR